MADQEIFPLRRSFLEQRLGNAVGIVQFKPRDFADRVSASTLAGALVSAADAPIGTLEFDTLTILGLGYAEEGDPKRLSLDTHLGSLLRQLGITPGTWQRRDLATALKRLYDVSLELPEYDDEGNEIGVRQRRLFSELAIYANSETLRAVDEGQRRDRLKDKPEGTEIVQRAGDGRVSRLVKIADADEARAEIVFAPWFAEAISERRGSILDLDTQRALEGIAKRVWVMFGMLPYVEADDDDYEIHDLEVNQNVFDHLRLKAARPTDNRKSLANALAKILERDPTYRRLEILEVRRGHKYVLAIERHTGAAKQAALRHRERDRRRSPMAA